MLKRRTPIIPSSLPIRQADAAEIADFLYFAGAAGAFSQP